MEVQETDFLRAALREDGRDRTAGAGPLQPGPFQKLSIIFLRGNVGQQRVRLLPGRRETLITEKDPDAW